MTHYDGFRERNLDIDKDWKVEELFPTHEQQVAILSSKPRLHWFQWLTYIIVIITCLAVLGMAGFNYYVVSSVMDALQEWSHRL